MEPKIQIDPSVGSGTTVSEQEIKEASKSWNAEQWEQYLQSLEGGQAEDLAALQEVSRSGLAP